MADQNATDAGGNGQLIELLKALPGPDWVKLVLGGLILLLPSLSSLVGPGKIDQQAIEKIVEERINEYEQNARARESSLATKFDGMFYSTNAALARQYGLCIGYTDESMRLNRLKSLNQSLTLKYSNASPQAPSTPSPPVADRPPTLYNREKYP
jgi:hypothetical protein